MVRCFRIQTAAAVVAKKDLAQSLSHAEKSINVMAKERAKGTPKLSNLCVFNVQCDRTLIHNNITRARAGESDKVEGNREKFRPSLCVRCHNRNETLI
jgi:hypothetical protein